MLAGDVAVLCNERNGAFLIEWVRDHSDHIQLVVLVQIGKAEEVVVVLVDFGQYGTVIGVNNSTFFIHILIGPANDNAALFQ